MHLVFMKYLIRNIGLKILPKFKYKEMLHIDGAKCIGYISINGWPILYGWHYRMFWNLGMIE